METKLGKMPSPDFLFYTFFVSFTTFPISFLQTGGLKMAIRQRNEKRRGKDERLSVAQIGGDRSCQKQGKYSSDKRYKEHEKPPLSV